MRKRVLSILLTILLLLALTGCSKEPDPNVKFYLTEQISTYFGTSTTRTVTEYDEDWNQSKIITWQNEELVSTVEYEVTETGYIARGTQDGVEETLELRVTKDEDGMPLRGEQYINGELYSTSEYTYDENGNMLVFYSDMHAVGMVLRQEYTYDEMGNKIKQTDDTGYGVVTTQYEYDSQNRLVKEFSPDSPGWTEYEYSNGGKTQTAFAYDENGTLAAKMIETYDDYGNLLTREAYDASGECTYTMAYRYIGTDGTVSSGIKG